VLRLRGGKKSSRFCNTGTITVLTYYLYTYSRYSVGLYEVVISGGA